MFQHGKTTLLLNKTLVHIIPLCQYDALRDEINAMCDNLAWILHYNSQNMKIPVSYKIEFSLDDFIYQKILSERYLSKKLQS